MPVAAMAADYAHGTLIQSHRHRRAQLLYATQGVMVVRSKAMRWVVPPTRGVWLVAGQEHEVWISGDLHMRTVFVEPGAAAHLPDQSCVLAVSPLLRELILAAIEVPARWQADSRDGRLMQLLLDELHVTPILPLSLPLPRDRRLARICRRLLKAPDDERTVAQWAEPLGLTARTVHRLFAADTGMTFGQWRQQARLLAGLAQLAQGEKVAHVALAAGYRSQSAFAAMFKRHFGIAPTAFFETPSGGLSAPAAMCPAYPC